MSQEQLGKGVHKPRTATIPRAGIQTFFCSIHQQFPPVQDPDARECNSRSNIYQVVLRALVALTWAAYDITAIPNPMFTFIHSHSTLTHICCLLHRLLISQQLLTSISPWAHLFPELTSWTCETAKGLCLSLSQLNIQMPVPMHLYHTCGPPALCLPASVHT